MKEIEQEIHNLAKKAVDIQKKTVSGLITGVVALVAGCFFAASHVFFSKKLSLVIYGILSFCVGLLVLFFAIKHKVQEHIHVTKMNRLTKQFYLTIKPLKNSLEDVKSSCGSLRRNSAETFKFTQLELNILELFIITETLGTITTLHFALQQAEKVKKVSDGFIKIKNDLETFNQHYKH